jgi:DNA-binding CsgD family transcriptional regulator
MAGKPTRFRKRTPLGTVHLTPSETCVLALLPTHLTLAAIGNELGIGRPTVKTHVQHIYEKLGASNRAEAVQLAASAGPESSGGAPGSAAVEIERLNALRSIGVITQEEFRRGKERALA